MIEEINIQMIDDIVCPIEMIDELYVSLRNNDRYTMSLEPHG